MHNMFTDRVIRVIISRNNIGMNRKKNKQDLVFHTHTHNTHTYIYIDKSLGTHAGAG